MERPSKPLSVDAYIAEAPRGVRGRLRELRAAIKGAAPTAVERISYGMPFYEYKGRLVYFAAAKAHLGLYIPPPIIQNYRRDLAGYRTTKSAVHLPLDGALPFALIKKLVKARMRFNEAKERSRRPSPGLPGKRSYVK